MDRHSLLPAGPGWTLTEAELRLVACAAIGKRWTPKSRRAEVARNADPALAAQWDQDRVIRAQVIRCLAIGERWSENAQPWPVHFRGIEIMGARIDGKLDLHGCDVLVNLGFHGCALDRGIDLGNARFHSLYVSRSLVRSLDARHAIASGSIHLRSGVRIAQGANFSSARIGGRIDCRGSAFDAINRAALDFSRAQIEGDLDCTGCRIESVKVAAVDLRSARIGGNLNFAGSALQTQSEHALEGRLATVSGAAFLNSNFRATAAVNLSNVQIRGVFECSGSTFETPGDGPALICTGIVAQAGIRLNRTTVIGGASFKGAVTEGSFDSTEAHFSSARRSALSLAFAQARSGLLLHNTSFEGHLNLGQARTSAYCDEGLKQNDAGRIVLDGFVYERFQDCTARWDLRVKWLERQPHDHLGHRFRPQPWAQLINVLREMGHDEDARSVAMERERISAHRDSDRWYSALWYWFLRVSVGYGYKPWHSLRISIALIAFGWATFAWAANLGYVAPRDGTVLTYLNDHPDTEVLDRYTRFNALVYALDIYLPVIELGQDEAWEVADEKHGYVRPLEKGQGWATCVSRFAFGQNSQWQPRKKGDEPGCGSEKTTGVVSWVSAVGDFLFSNGFHRLVFWLERILGLIFISLYIAGMSGLMKEE